MTAALNAWKDASKLPIMLPEVNSPASRVQATEKFESQAVLRVISNAVTIFDSIPPLPNDYFPMNSDKKWFFRTTAVAQSKIKEIPAGFKAVIVNNEAQWAVLQDQLKKHQILDVYNRELKQFFTGYAEHKDTQNIYNKVLEGVLLFFRDAISNPRKLDLSREEEVEIKELVRKFSLLTETVKQENAPNNSAQVNNTKRNSLILAISYRTLNGVVDDLKSKINSSANTAEWTWTDEKLKKVKP